jgi:8-oxo-dGTP pyrophosphatase MutT (NUDIX family)
LRRSGRSALLRTGGVVIAAAKKAELKTDKTVARPGKKALRDDRAIRVQYGVLPYRISKSNGLEILLVTTRRSKRWSIPKGWPIKDLKPSKAAAREAYEEAGIRGTVGTKSIGGFFYGKRLEDSLGIVPCEVRVFPMIVKRQLDKWPEAEERETGWFEPANALAVVEAPELRALIASFSKRHEARGSSSPDNEAAGGKSTKARAGTVRRG